MSDNTDNLCLKNVELNWVLKRYITSEQPELVTILVNPKPLIHIITPGAMFVVLLDV